MFFSYHHATCWRVWQCAEQSQSGCAKPSVEQLLALPTNQRKHLDYTKSTCAPGWQESPESIHQLCPGYGQIHSAAVECGWWWSQRQVCLMMGSRTWMLSQNARTNMLRGYWTCVWPARGSCATCRQSTTMLATEELPKNLWSIWLLWLCSFLGLHLPSRWYRPLPCSNRSVCQPAPCIDCIRWSERLLGTPWLCVLEGRPTWIAQSLSWNWSTDRSDWSMNQWTNPNQWLDQWLTTIQQINKLLDFDIFALYTTTTHYYSYSAIMPLLKLSDCQIVLYTCNELAVRPTSLHYGTHRPIGLQWFCAIVHSSVHST